MLRILSNGETDVKRDLYACFLHYTRAFDRVRHEKLIKILQNLNLYEKDI